MIADFGMRIVDCCKNRTEGKPRVMSKKWSVEFPIHSSMSLKSVFRNPKSAILLGAMLYALCLSADAQ
jgi:hypothetical protein